MYYNFVDEVFTQRNTVADFLQVKCILYGKRRFCVLSPLWGLRGNVRCLSYAHWTARSKLPISVDRTYFR